MIHLDANFLIGSVDQHSSPAILLKKWLENGETFAASSVAWAEFLNGPIKSDQVQFVDISFKAELLLLGALRQKFVRSSLI